MQTRTPSGLSMFAVNAPVMVRLAPHTNDGREYTARIEDVTASSVVVTAPAGASSALLASGTREIELSWLSPRGRYEQRCRLEPGGGFTGREKQWRLRPLRQPVLIQRRRYIRVRARVEVSLDVAGEQVAGATVDVSEGGFRVRMPRRELPDSQPTVVTARIGGATVALSGYVVRSVDVDDETEAVIAFSASGDDAAAVRRFILRNELRARAERDS